MTDLQHLDLSHLRFTVELGIDWQDMRQCAVEAGPFPTLEDAIVFAQSVRGKKAQEVLDTVPFSNDFNVHHAQGLQQPLVGATVEGFTEDGTQFSYDLNWSPVTVEDVLSKAEFGFRASNPALIYKGKFRTWYITVGREDDALGHIYTAVCDPMPYDDSPIADHEDGNLRSIYTAAEVVALCENMETTPRH